jgi:hypothetical protein
VGQGWVWLIVGWPAAGLGGLLSLEWSVVGGDRLGLLGTLAPAVVA